MNKNNKVITFILLVASIHFLFSIFSNKFIVYYPNFKNINLISDLVFKNDSSFKKKRKKTKLQTLKFIDSMPVYTFDAYHQKGTIMAFDKDTLQPVLNSFTEKLIALSENKKVKIRIAWYGDSQIEGDLITQDLRELLQNYFKQQKAVGYVPISCVSNDFRATAKMNTEGDIKIDNFKKNVSKSSLFLSGYSFFSEDLSIDFRDNLAKNSTQKVEKWLLFGKGDSISITLNEKAKKYPANKVFNRVLLGNSLNNGIQFNVISPNTPLYGISSEPESGIILDNFSFRGITGTELNKISSSLLDEINTTGYYDLVVFQYGVNLMFKPDDTNYDYYYRSMNNVLKKFKSKLPKTDLLLFSCSDRAFKYDEEWKTATGIDSLIYNQALLARNNDIGFYNFYESLGGKGSIVKWADSTSQLANKDYIHFNLRGSRVAAKIVFNAIINDYKKALRINETKIQEAKKVKASTNKSDSIW